MAVTLSRDDLIQGLRELIAELKRLKRPAGIRIVGGAALALKHFDRESTQDLDALRIQTEGNEGVVQAARQVALRHGWNINWLNFEVEQVDALPSFGRREPEWETIYDDGSIVIQVASKETLLAMKLRANRPGRDTDDIRKLLRLCGIANVEDAEAFYEDFYPGDILPDRAVIIVRRIFELGLPESVRTPKQLEI